MTAEHSSHHFLSNLIGWCGIGINGMGKTMTSLINQCSRVLNSNAIEDMKAHVSIAQSIVARERREAQK